MLDIDNSATGAQTATATAIPRRRGIAIIDSGILLPQNDLLSTGSKTTSRVVYSQSFVPKLTGTSDQFGHGTHVAGILAGNGANSTGSSYFATFRVLPGREADQPACAGWQRRRYRHQRHQRHQRGHQAEEHLQHSGHHCCREPAADRMYRSIRPASPHNDDPNVVSALSLMAALMALMTLVSVPAPLPSSTRRLISFAPGAIPRNVAK